MRKIIRPLVLLTAFGCAGGAALRAADDALEVAVVGQVADTYQRQRLPNGTFRPERYALANGGMIAGTTRDESVEKVPFPVIANVVGRHLAAQRYFLAQKAGDADLLIVLHWGNTLGYEHNNYGQSVTRSATAISAMKVASGRRELMKRVMPRASIETADIVAGEQQRASDDLESSLTIIGLENRARDMANLDNAKALGYLDAVNARREALFSEVSGASRDLIRDVEEKRYYVTVSAYDFRALREKNQQVLRWVTRISISAGSNSFDERLAQMVASAADTFGQESELRRRFYGDPRVELGEVEYLGVAAPADAAGRKPGK